MITLKNKIIRNFIAGILACILVFSILVTLLVTFNSREQLKRIPDDRPTTVGRWFRYYMGDPNMTMDDVWIELDNLADELEVDVIFKDTDGTALHTHYGRDDESTAPINERELRYFNVDRNEYAGTLHVYFNPDRSPYFELQRNFSVAIIYGLLISLIIGIIISLILSENISEPIMMMSYATVMIKDGYYDIGDEITDIRELENLQNNINYLSKNLKNQEEIRKQYAQDISHELRTPLTNLQLYIEAIRDGVIEADENTMDILLEEVNRLEGLVVGLKKTFDLNVEHLEINNEDFDLSQLVDRIAKSFIPNAENNNIKITSFIEDDIMIRSDREKFSQILQNLISNAIKAIGSDGEVGVFLSSDTNEITIKVVDDGVGIEEDKIDMIFERFYRIEDARNTKENGHGLGLSITKNFVEALGGRIHVDSVINEGTVFTLSFMK